MPSSKEKFLVTKGGVGFDSNSRIVARALAGIERGEPFSIKIFNKLGLTNTEVSKILLKLLKAGEVKRAASGFYYRPSEHLKFLGLESLPSPEMLARSWARERGYVLVEQGLEEALRLGFQTQSVIHPVFWTDGPGREFRVGNAVVIVKRKADSKLLWPGEPIGRLYRALLVVPVSDQAVAQLRKVLSQCFNGRASTIDGLNKLADQATIKRWLCFITHERDRLLQR